GIDPCARRAATALRNHCGNVTLRSGEDRLNRTVATITHPALKVALKRGDLRPSAIADALHTAANDNMAVHRHANSPRFLWPARGLAVGTPACGEPNPVRCHSAAAAPRHYDFHVARPRYTSRTVTRDIDESAPSLAASNNWQPFRPIKSGRDILPSVKCDAIARREPPEKPVHAATGMRRNRGVTIRGDDEAVAFKTGNSNRDGVRRMLTHDRAMHVRAIGEVQH